VPKFVVLKAVAANGGKATYVNVDHVGLVFQYGPDVVNVSIDGVGTRFEGTAAGVVAKLEGKLR
jgi:hypothetical protein